MKYLYGVAALATVMIIALTWWWSSSPPAYETGLVSVNGHTISVEIAETRAQQSWGLSHRSHLPDDAAMLFVWNDEDIRMFWMKDTSIPLSIAFIRADGTITEIRDMEPMDTTHVTSSDAVQYALEVNQGWFDRHEITPDMTVKIDR